MGSTSMIENLAEPESFSMGYERTLYIYERMNPGIFLEQGMTWQQTQQHPY